MQGALQRLYCCEPRFARLAVPNGVHTGAEALQHGYVCFHGVHSGESLGIACARRGRVATIPQLLRNDAALESIKSPHARGAVAWSPSARVLHGRSGRGATFAAPHARASGGRKGVRRGITDVDGWVTR